MLDTKFFKKILYLFLILFPIIFILNIYSSIPSRIILPTDYAYTYHLKPFIKVTNKQNNKFVAATVQNAPLIQTVNKNVNIQSHQVGNYKISLDIFNSIPLKTINVVVLPKTYVVPSGKAVGVKLYTNGLLIVGISDVTLGDGSIVSPSKKAGLKVGDRILLINDTHINSSEDFSNTISSSTGAIKLTISRDNSTLDTYLTPVQSADDKKLKLGIWVRDSTAGIGTMTFSHDNKFAALGHAITDVDTGDIMTINKGNIVSCEILSVRKGERGNPGELLGSFTNSNLGSILINNELGIYGIIENDNSLYRTKPVEVATRFQIKEGSAYILADIDGNGVKSYQVEVQKISKNGQINNKGIVLKVIDSELLSKCGGIVQGMSGAPIIQNDMLIGAVTHVFVNDPTRGYGIFAENMLDMTYSIEK